MAKVKPCCKKSIWIDQWELFKRIKLNCIALLHFAVQVEGLFEEKDFQTKVTREQLLGLVDDLLQRVAKPLEEALKVSEITMVSS